MNLLVVIRDYRSGDELICKDIIRGGTMSTVNAAFVTGLTKEITFQAMVLTSAVMFIFMGVPLSVCLGSIPVVISLMYFIIYLAHMVKALELMQDVSNIPRFYMSSNHTGFWVAEAFEPCLMTRDPKQVNYQVLSENELHQQPLSVSPHLKKTIVGTVAITRSKTEDNTAWLRRMVVHPRYQRKGVASKLVDEAVKFAVEKGYHSIELVTSECHNGARELYLRKGFELKQMYLKHVFGSLVSILMYELTLSLKHRVPVNA